MHFVPVTYGFFCIRYGFTIRRAPKRTEGNGAAGSVLEDYDDEEEEEDAVDVDLVRKREVKWVNMLKQWDRYMLRDYKKVRSRCRKGIPASMRSRAWVHLCGAKYLMEKPENRDKYKQLCVSSPKIHP